MDKRSRHKITALSKFMSYMLRHRPDEFGLVLDEQGYVSFKEFLQAIHEEEGWRYVRRSHIQEVLLHDENHRFEITEKRIRALYGHGDRAPIIYTEQQPPKMLYHGTSRKSYPVIIERGLHPMGRKYVHLSTTREMALRIGQRKDPRPVILEVHAERAWEQGTKFYPANELIYLVEFLKPDFFTGPPLPKKVEKPEEKKPKEPPQPAGSFFLDLSRSMEDLTGPKQDRSSKKKKERKARLQRKAARRLKRES